MDCRPAKDGYMDPCDQPALPPEKGTCVNTRPLFRVYLNLILLGVGVFDSSYAQDSRQQFIKEASRNLVGTWLAEGSTNGNRMIVTPSRLYTYASNGKTNWSYTGTWKVTDRGLEVNMLKLSGPGPDNERDCLEILTLTKETFIYAAFVDSDEKTIFTLRKAELNTPTNALNKPKK